MFPEHAEKLPACLREAAWTKASGLAAGDLTGRVIGLAIKVHKMVGPGRPEQIWQDCLCHEMVLNGLRFQLQAGLSQIDDGVRLLRAGRTDIVTGETVILEIKSIEHIPPVHEARLPADLQLGSCAVGLLLNFNTNLLKVGSAASSIRLAPCFGPFVRPAFGQHNRSECAGGTQAFPNAREATNETRSAPRAPGTPRPP